MSGWSAQPRDASAGATPTHQLYRHLQTPCRGVSEKEGGHPRPCRFITAQAAGFCLLPGTGSSPLAAELPGPPAWLLHSVSRTVPRSPGFASEILHQTSAPTPALHLNVLPEEDRMPTSPTR